MDLHLTSLLKMPFLGVTHISNDQRQNQTCVLFHEKKNLMGIVFGPL